MIAEILPGPIVAVAVRGDDLEARLLPEEADALGWAVDARVREFARGRSCARRALTLLGRPHAPILRGTQRQPVWPPGVVGSITHCAGYTAAAVAEATEVGGLGIDAETHAPLPRDIQDQDLVLLDAERAWVARAPQGYCWDRLIFSAKEAIYKTWFPRTGEWLDFKDVLVTIDAAEGAFAAELRTESVLQHAEWIGQLVGRYLIRDGLILTAVTSST